MLVEQSELLRFDGVEFAEAIDDDVLAYARQLAEDSGRPLGTVLSDLVRCGMRTKAPATTRNGIRLLPAPQGARRATLDHVKKLRDDIP